MNTQEFGACAMALNLFARLFLEAPDQIFLSQIGEARVFDQWPLPCPDREAADALQFLRTALEPHGESRASAMNGEYNALFLSPDHAVPLWESVWTTKDRLLFDGPMFDVRAQYARYGLASPNPDREPDDHIGLELSFLGGVMGCAAESLENGDAEAARTHADVADAFLQQHLFAWAPRLLAAVAERGEAPIYGAVALLCGSVLDHAANVLKEARA
ncbi:TorD/DmsD family molecular chaperone [Desulfovibrio caledoniensis]